MNRFEKKCFVGSATFHGVLLAVIFIGAAFSSNKLPSDMGPTITMLPNPGAAPSGNGAPPPAAPPARPALPEPEPPQPKPEQVKQPDPEPPVKPKITKRDEPKETEKEKGDLQVPVKKDTKKEVVKDAPKTSPLVNTKVVRRSNVVDQTAMKMAAAQRERDLRATRIAQANEQARRDAVIAEMNDIVRGNGTGLGHSRVVSPNSIGAGGGDGVASGRYGDGLKAIYDSKWILNADAFDDEASATVRVTVKRDGTVVSSSITKPSGNASFDRSVRSVLNNVTRVPPFTPDMKDSERVFTWRFEKRTKAG